MRRFLPYLLQITFCSVLLAPTVQAHTCKSLLNNVSDSAVRLPRLDLSLVSDAYRELTFPVLNYRSVRPIENFEVQEALDNLYGYYLATLSYAQGLPQDEGKFFLQLLKTI